MPFDIADLECHYKLPLPNNQKDEDHANCQYDSVEFMGEMLIHMHGAVYRLVLRRLSVKTFETNCFSVAEVSGNVPDY